LFVFSEQVGSIPEGGVVDFYLVEDERSLSDESASASAATSASAVIERICRIDNGGGGVAGERIGQLVSD
jgi:hypothetical protein